jgi:hypothetical protein
MNRPSPIVFFSISTMLAVTPLIPVPKCFVTVLFQVNLPPERRPTSVHETQWR